MGGMNRAMLSAQAIIDSIVSNEEEVDLSCQCCCCTGTCQDDPFENDVAYDLPGDVSYTWAEMAGVA